MKLRHDRCNRLMSCAIGAAVLMACTQTGDPLAEKRSTPQESAPANRTATENKDERMALGRTDASGAASIAKSGQRPEAAATPELRSILIHPQTADRARESEARPAQRQLHAQPVPHPSLHAPAVPPAAAAPGQVGPYADIGREIYAPIDENPIKRAIEAPVSTFSIDVDTGAYANVRRFLKRGQLPPSEAVRVEELINYFPYAYARPGNAEGPFKISMEIAPTPWNEHTQLLRIGIKGKDIAKDSLPPANLVFLVDVSGSMSPPERLPLLKQGLRLLVAQLRAQDRVSLVTYASGTRIVLEPTPGSEKATILRAIDELRAGGSTAGAAGIQLAYDMAERGYIQGGINRVLLGTDGDFNVGVTRFETLKQMVADKRKGGISLSTLGFGAGNYNERLMEQLADAGDGNYSYIDTILEAKKVLVNEMTSTLAVIAKDVKLQVEFNPGLVAEYRLIGYENRRLNREDFRNDQVDAGEIGAGHTVTALYEIALAGSKGLMVEPLRYGTPRATAGEASEARSGEIAHLRVRYKEPEATVSRELAFPIARDGIRPLGETSVDFRFAAAVASFGQLLRGGKHTNGFTYEQVLELARGSRGDDTFGYRGEFLQLVDLARTLQPVAMR